jgi:hypothetical protein
LSSRSAGLPAWLRSGVRLVRRQHVTVENLTTDGFWARDDAGSPVWIPAGHLGVVWDRVRVRARLRYPAGKGLGRRKKGAGT